MSQEKLLNLTKYVDSLKNRLSDTTIPEKHKHRPKEYKEFLERELKKTSAKVEDLKLSSDDLKKK